MLSGVATPAIQRSEELPVYCPDSFVAMFTFIHPPTCLDLLTFWGGLCVSVYMFVCIFFFEWCVYMLSAPTHRMGYIGPFFEAVFVHLPSHCVSLAGLLTNYAPRTKCVYECTHNVCAFNSLQRYCLFNFFCITAATANFNTVLCIQISTETTYWQMTCVSWKNLQNNIFLRAIFQWVTV